MIGSIFQTVFGCSHRRLTRPITRVRKPGITAGETSVVCLDCGKEFVYDWNHMKIGKPVEKSQDSGILPPNMPRPAATKMKYALIGTAIPFAAYVGRALVEKRRARAAAKPDPAPGAVAADANLDQRIRLPHDHPEAGFVVHQLVDFMRQSGRDFIIIGAVDCALADHPRPASLDYWLRENFAANKETKQATGDVVAQLLATGLFEQLGRVRCPDLKDLVPGLRLKPSGRPAESAAG